MTDDSKLFRSAPGPGLLPLWEGKQFHQFQANFALPHYWLDEGEARAALLAPRLRALQRQLVAQAVMQAPDPERVSLDYRSYRLAFRDVGRNTDERTVIACLLPPDRFCPHTVSLEQVFFDEVTPKGHQSVRRLNTTERLFVLAIFNSIVFDWFIRQSVTAHVSFFFVYNTPAPRLAADSKQALALVNRAARLTCTTSEFDALAREVGLEHHQPLDPMDRARLRAELDGLVAHLYGLSEAEFAHILASFPLVPEPVKVDAHNAYRRVAQGLIT